jgi:hypothetical protein
LAEPCGWHIVFRDTRRFAGDGCGLYLEPAQ